MLPGIYCSDWICFSFPFNFSLVLFIAFAFLVVHVGQRLVERAALVIEHSERRFSIIRTSICIGSLVWALDVAGLFLYQGISAQDASLVSSFFALAVMVGSALLTVPAFITTIKPMRTVFAALSLSVGMIFAHMALMTSIGNLSGSIRWSAVSLSIFLAGLISGGLSLRHRVAQLYAAKSEFRSLPWFENLIAGFVILFLHLCLVNVFVITPRNEHSMNGGFLILLVLVLFGVVLSVDQMFHFKIDEKHQAVFNRALALERSIHSEGIDNARHQTALIAERLSKLLAPGSLQLHFQPICPTQGFDEKIRFEALLRIKDRDLGSINPEIFFLACDRAGKTTCADRAVIVHAVNASMPWVHLGIDCCGISVNVAPATLLESGFIDWIGALLQEKSMPMGWLQLEITEHAMIAQTVSLAGIIKKLRPYGITVVMDDFGSGFSSLTALADLPIHGIKCDRAFVHGIATDSSRQILLQHICEMGKSLGLIVTVEGIETQDDLAIVREKGASAVQGYIFAKAMHPDLVPNWLEKHKNSATADFTEKIYDIA
jgi:EAL domain-containing protein (putative c-di-GMP-specific phosphodiesterase class I)